MLYAGDGTYGCIPIHPGILNFQQPKWYSYNWIKAWSFTWLPIRMRIKDLPENDPVAWYWFSLCWMIHMNRFNTQHSVSGEISNTIFFKEKELSTKNFKTENRQHLGIYDVAWVTWRFGKMRLDVQQILFAGSGWIRVVFCARVRPRRFYAPAPPPQMCRFWPTVVVYALLKNPVYPTQKNIANHVASWIVIVGATTCCTNG